MMGKLLTIAIPTYNRPEQIQNQVRILIPQLTEDVELLVLDNCSTNPINTLFTSDELSKIKICRHSSNKTLVGNWLSCFEESKTNWMWSLSDDDELIDGVVKKILEAINEYKDAIFLNIQVDREVVLTGFYEYAEELRNFGSFLDSFWMSKCIYNVELLRPSFGYHYIYLSTMIGPVIMILRHLEANPQAKCVLLKTNIIKSYKLDNSWMKSEYIKLSSLLFDAFKLEKRTFLFHNVFYSQTKLFFLFILQQFTLRIISKKETYYLFRLTIFKFGLFRSLINFPLLIFRSLILFILPYRFADCLRNIKNCKF